MPCAERYRPRGTRSASSPWPRSCCWAVLPFYARSQLSQAFVDALVSPVDLPDVVDGAGPLCRQGGQQYCHPRTYVRAIDGSTPQGGRSGDDGPVRIAQDDAGSHPNQFVDEEETRLEHFFEDQYHDLALGGNDDGDGDEVGGER